MTEIAIAYDVDSLERALDLDARLGEGPEIAKVGLQLYTAAGPDAVRALRQRGRRVFLDLKLHDIPNTVRGAAAAAARLDAELLTVHAMGGAEMVRAAVDGIARVRGGTRVVAVTILTSISPYNAPPGFQSPLWVGMVAGSLLGLSLAAGAAGVVCSPLEVAGLKAGKQAFYAVTPGIRPAGGAKQDQQRVATVAEATRAGADLLVLGRAITESKDPRAALEAVRAERDAAIPEAVAH
jgi:orotidine-5'-phosphate decarboxylase